MITMMTSSAIECYLDDACSLFISTTIKQSVDSTVIQLICGKYFLALLIRLFGTFGIPFRKHVD